MSTARSSRLQPEPGRILARDARESSPRRASRSLTRHADPDLFLILTGAYLVAAATRVHAVLPALAATKPILVSAVLALLFYASRRHPKIRSVSQLRMPLVTAILFLVLWGTIGAPIGIYAGQSVRFLFDELYKITLLFLLATLAVRQLDDVRTLMRWFVAGATLFALFRVLPNAGSRNSIGGGGYDPNDVGMLMVACVPLALYSLHRSSRPAQRVVAAGIVGLLCVSIVLTESRGAFLGLIAAGAYSVLHGRSMRPGMRVAAVVGAVAVIGLTASAEYWQRMRTVLTPGDDYNTQSLTGRKEVWLRGVGYTISNPIFGVGVANFPVAEGRHPVIAARIAAGRGTKYSAAHSMWVQAAAELGFPGLAALGAFFVLALRSLRRLQRRPPPGGDYAAVASTLLGMLIAIVVTGTFLSQAYGYVVWGGMGLVAGLVKVARADGFQDRAWTSAAARGRRARTAVAGAPG